MREGFRITTDSKIATALQLLPASTEAESMHIKIMNNNGDQVLIMRSPEIPEE